MGSTEAPDLKKVQEIFDEEIQQAENDIETSAFIKWLKGLRDRVLEQVSQKSDEPESRATDKAQFVNTDDLIESGEAWQCLRCSARTLSISDECAECHTPRPQTERPLGWRSHAHYSIAVDFDGVIHSYLSPWEGAHIIPDPPVLGALDWLEEMARRFHIIIFSTRCLTPEGCAAVRQYLSSHWHVAYHPGFGRVIDCYQQLPPGLVDGFECTATKEAALIYLDDRAVRFDGTNFPTANDIHRRLIPWNKKAMNDSKHRI